MKTKVWIAVDARAPALDRENCPAFFRLDSGAFLLNPRTVGILEPKLNKAGVQIEHCDPGKARLTPQSLEAMLDCVAG